jgi:hypothetical protein
MQAARQAFYPPEELLAEVKAALARTKDVPDGEPTLGITAVHPMREDAVKELLAQTGDNWDVVEGLLRGRSLQESSCNGHRYYLRKFTK